MTELFAHFDWNAFHFIRPQWLWALLPLSIILLFLHRIKRSESGWQHFLPSHLQSVMLSEGGPATKHRRPPFGLLALGWFVGVILLAGPTWERLPQPVYNLKQGNVIVLDMSLSMRATDVIPDRLTRARFKAIDLVSQLGDGEVGMVAYAGDAFVISPLTEDANNLVAMIPSISPEIMPVPGSDPLRGFEVASELLANAGYQQGNIFWFTDGMEQQQFSRLAEFVEASPYTLHALAIGTQEGAPIKQLNGELLKDNFGAIVVPRMEPSKVRAVSNRSGGSFARLTASDSDIKTLLDAAQMTMNSATEQEDDETNTLQGDSWNDVGAYLVVFLLPLAAYAFRRGILMCIPLLFAGLMLNPQPVYAQNVAADNDSSWLSRMFQTDDQRGQAAFDQAQYDKAAEAFSDPMWQGSAHYRNQEFEKALQAFEQVNTLDALYNQGNALAKLGRLEEAIDKYQQVLDTQPDHQFAKENKALLEELLKQQEQQQQDNQQQSSDEQQDSQNSDSEQQSQSSNSSGSQQQQEQQESSQSENEDQSSDESQNNDQQNAQSSDQSQADDAPMREQQPQPPNDSAEENSEESEQQETSSQQQNEEQQQPASEEPLTGNAQQAEEPLSDEEREAMQRMQTLLRKIPDDPAFLLQRKMQLESQQRRRERAPPSQSNEW
ncbi:vWA domain-containing protein [Alteromonas facilis]|uniref:vWA domain-containing protein n=1 Tax=Alteromonas facilis TaxID=2048004 RepID=UPI000C28EC53|nr:VWA domain-containing protein [Alteromonas facilis]